MAENKFLDDIAKFGNTTLTAMSGMQRQVRKWAGEQVDTLIDNMELVNRKELAVHKEIAEKALAKVEALEKRITQLEAGAKRKPAKSKAKR